MAVITWFLLSLLIVPTITGEGTGNRYVRDDPDTLQSVLEDWRPKRLARK